MNKVIYDSILEAITEDGMLSKEFALPEEGSSEIKFAPGAMDGILLYHSGLASEKAEECMKMIIEAINSASAGNEEKAIEIVDEYADQGRTLQFADQVQNYIIENQTKLDAGNIMHLAVRLMLNGTKIEAVKLGFIMVELFNTNQNEKLKEIVRTYALCDEFALFAAFVMQQWENSEMELWNAAKLVRGWGRVHLMRVIDPKGNEEIEQWMLLHGVHNEVLPAYSGLDVFEKTHFKSRLKGELSLEMYRGMADVMEAILDEGPVSGISAIDGADDLLQSFIQATKKRNDLEADDYQACKEILSYMEENNDEDQVFTESIKELKEFL